MWRHALPCNYILENNMNKHKNIPVEVISDMDINHILTAPNGVYLRAVLCVIVNHKWIVIILLLLVSLHMLIPSNKSLLPEKFLDCSIPIILCLSLLCPVYCTALRKIIMNEFI